MTFDILRIPHNKAFQCYLIMTIWILLLVAGVYKFLEPRHGAPEPVVTSEVFQTLTVDAKTRKIYKICNFPNDILPGGEGIRSNKWMLKGLITLIRHGDRGPLQHVRNISSVNCAGDATDLMHSYKTYLNNITISSKTAWAGPGPFHAFPLLPTHPKHCQLGQLTYQGVNQLLVLGDILKQSYVDLWPKLMNLSQHEVLVYSTRYRRTFQSALAFLFGFINKDVLAKISVLESQSMNFCFGDCGCPLVDKLAKKVVASTNKQLKTHPAVAVLAAETGRLVFSPSAEQGIFRTEPQSVRDALLTYVCHGGNLPCEGPTNCVKRQMVAGVFTYTDWVNHQKWRNKHWKMLCYLKSYGLVRHIVQQMLHMMSSNGPYLVVYSGHDHTIEQLSTTFGLQPDPFLLRYGARLIIEVYQDNRNIETEPTGIGIYFRLLSNGKDVTRQIRFCKNTVTLENRVALCRMEDIVRFLHEDYFSYLNVTNFKDACVSKFG